MDLSVRNNLAAVREEILDLLRQQMQVLDSPQGLTDDRLRECYMRQTRVQELREQLQMALISQETVHETTRAEQANANAASAIPLSQPAPAEQCAT